MSTVRIASGALVLSALLIGAGWIVTSAMPLRALASLDDPTAVSTGTIQFSLASPLPKPTKQVQPAYPDELLRAGVGAQVTATIDIDANGRVTDIRDPSWQLTLSDRHSIDDVPGFWAGKPWQRFVDAFETAMRQWTFEPNGVSTFPVSVVFTSGGEVRTFAPAPPPPPPPPPPPGSDVREKLRLLEEARRKIDESRSRSQGVIGPVTGSSSPGDVPNAAPPRFGMSGLSTRRKPVKPVCRGLLSSRFESARTDRSLTHRWCDRFHCSITLRPRQSASGCSSPRC
jgi:hypothetical protein